MTRIIILAAPNTLSAQLAEIQKQGLVPSGPTIRWDNSDCLAPEGKGL